MKKVYYRGRSQQPVPKWVATLVITALSLIAIVAVVLAMAHLNANNPNAGQLPSGSQDLETPEPTPEPAPVPEPSPEPEFESPTMARLLAASATPGHLLRAQVGSCTAGGGAVEVSTDSGATWTNGSLAKTEIAQVLQLNGVEPAVDRLVGLDADCEPVTAWSFIGGVDWGVEDAAATWYLDPTDARMVQTPSGAQPLACDAVGLSSLGDRALVLCEDSTVMSSADAGATWSAPVAAPNGVAVGIAPATFVVVSVGESECAGVRTRMFDGNALGEAGACVDVSGAAGGNLAIAGDDTALYLWAGDSFLRSNDLGASWS